MVSPPAPVTNGTVTYMMLTIATVFAFWVSGRMKWMSNDNSQIAVVIAVTLGFSMWMFWLTCWMHQWHPLIFPEWHDE